MTTRTIPTVTPTTRGVQHSIMSPSQLTVLQQCPLADIELSQIQEVHTQLQPYTLSMQGNSSHLHLSLTAQ